MQTATLATVVPPPLWQTIALAAGPACIVAITAIVGQILAHRFAVEREKENEKRRNTELRRKERVSIYGEILYNADQALHEIRQMRLTADHSGHRESAAYLLGCWRALRQAAHRLVTVEDDRNRLIWVENLSNAVFLAAEAANNLSAAKNYFENIDEEIKRWMEEVQLSLSESKHIRYVWTDMVRSRQTMVEDWKESPGEPLPTTTQDETGAAVYPPSQKPFS